MTDARPSNAPMPILEVRGLHKSYDDGRIQALRGVDLKIAAGEFLAISGPSGSGKSTLLQLLGGLDIPTSGEVLFKNAALGSAVDLDTYRCQQVGFIFQAFYLLPTLRALENVQVPMLAAAESGKSRLERAEALLAEMGLEHRLNQFPNELSAGERQRVAIARALANNPTILLADEPTGNLDRATASEVIGLIGEIHRELGTTVVMVSHDEEMAMRVADRVLRLRDGRLEPEGGRGG